jgi:hypothetical protein
MKGISALLFIFCSASCLAAEGFRIPTNLLSNGEKGEYIDPALYDVAGVSIKKDSFVSILEKLGASTILSGHHTDKHMCYLTSQGTVDFIKSSLGYGYEVSKNQVDISKCGNALVKLTNGAGLELGMPKSEVINILGEPSKSTDGSLIYTYWVQEVPDDEEQARVRRISGWTDSEEVWRDIYSTVTVKLKDGIVDGFGVYTSESY